MTDATARGVMSSDLRNYLRGPGFDHGQDDNSPVDVQRQEIVRRSNGVRNVSMVRRALRG
jgi:hypothetical protein